MPAYIIATNALLPSVWVAFSRPTVCAVTTAATRVAAASFQDSLGKSVPE